MPPKKKGSSKKAAKARTPTLIDGLTKEEMSKEQLKDHILHLREELDREREERNYFQLERDKIQTFCGNTVRQLDEAKAELKNLDKEIEDDERRHQEEIKVYRQKMKHLLCEQQNTITELKADALVSVEAVQKEQEQLENELHEEMVAVMVNLQELDYENIIKELEQKHAEEITEARNNLEKQVAEAQARCQKKTELHVQDLENMRKQKLSNIKTYWGKHMQDLNARHHKTLRQINKMIDALREVEETNTSLKDSLKAMQVKLNETEKELALTLREEKRMTKLVLGAAQENAKVEKKLKNTPVKKGNKGKIMAKELDDLKLKHEALKQKFIQAQLERDELKKTFSQKIEKVQQKVGVRTVQLEKKLDTLTDHLDKTDAQLSVLLSDPGVDQTALAEAMKTIEAKLDSSNNTIKNLQVKKAVISKARKDLLQFFEAKQRDLGIPVEELCVKLSESCLDGRSLGQGLDLVFAPK